MTIALKGGAIEVVYRYWYMSDIGRLNGGEYCYLM